MVHLFAVILFAVFTLISVSLQKTYSRVPLKELKRRAVKGDEVAKALHSVASYGISLQILLWVFVGVMASGFFVVFSVNYPSWLAFIGSVALLWFAFAWLPNTKVSAMSEKIATTTAPIFSWILARIYPVLNKIGFFIKKYSNITIHSGLYQKEDVIELLDKQQHQSDNRMSVYEIEIAKSALKFSDRLIREVMTPKRVVKFVSAEDAIGPILMTELHKSGFSRFPVTGDNPEEIVGTLYIHDLVKAKDGGLVKSYMQKSVYYVNEEKTLDHALKAFLHTKHHLFMVVNNFEEIVGIITIEDVLEQVLGTQIVDEFDQYEDLRAVASLHAKKDQKTHTHATSEVVEKAHESTKTNKK